MPLPLGDHLRRLVGTVLEANRTLLCTDFDGTLVPICADPDACRLGDELRSTLSSLHRPPRMHVAVVSGRQLADVRLRVGIQALTYAGNHGLEIEGAGLSFRNPGAEACQDLVDTLATALREDIAAFRGTRLEHKGLSLTIHHRQAHPAVVATIHDAVAATLSRVDGTGRMRTHHGKCVLEIRPDVAWNKGHAVEWLGQQLRCGSERRIFIGDDETDEDGFAACLDGVTIRVVDSAATTAARYLASQGEATAFLTMLGQAINDNASRPPEAAVDVHDLPRHERRVR